MEKEKNRNITNPDNYKKVFKNTDNMVFEYVKIMHEYLSHIMTYMKIKDKLVKTGGTPTSRTQTSGKRT